MPDIDLVSQNLNAIPGAPPPLTDLPTGCSFHPRCPLATEVCRVQRPELLQLGSRASACHHTHLLEGALR
jgi:oligopeptide/dipeptide ABC transporter ATP-binding protein